MLLQGAGTLRAHSVEIDSYVQAQTQLARMQVHPRQAAVVQSLWPHSLRALGST